MRHPLYTLLPDSLARQLEAVEARLRWVRGLSAASAAGALLLLSLLAFALTDRVLDTPRGLRVLFLAAGLAGAVASVVCWAAAGLRHGRDRYATIALVERRFRALGDTLRGVTELVDPSHPRGNVSPELCQAAVRQVADRVRDMDLRPSVPTQQLRRWTRLAGAAALLCVSAAILEHELAWNALRRWCTPLAAVPRYTFARLQPLASTTKVARGEPFDITVRLHPDARWRPGSVQARLAGSRSMSAGIENGAAVLRFAGLNRDARLTLRCGDARTAIDIMPVTRPTLTRLAAEVQWPAYTGRDNERLDLLESTPRLLPGCTVRLHGEASAPRLTGVELSATGPIPLELHGASFASSWHAPAAFLGSQLSWVDGDGFAGIAPHPVPMELRDDALPTVSMSETPAVSAILETEVLDMPITADDDFGVRGITLTWKLDRVPDGVTVSQTAGKEELIRGGPTVEALSATYSLAPRLMGIPAGCVLNLKATTEDYAPGQRTTHSRECRVYVLDASRHAELIRRRFERLQEHLEDAARTEEALHDENLALAEESDDGSPGDQTGRELRDQAVAEETNAADVGQLAEQGADILREALRNPRFDDALLRTWAELMEELNDLASEAMPAVAGDLRQAAADPGRRAETLAEAIEKQKEILETLGRAAGGVDDALSDFQGRNLAARLWEAQKQETNIAATARQLLPETAGALTERLAPPLRERVTRLTASHNAVAADVSQVLADLMRCFTETHIPVFRAVHDAMQDADTVNGLGKLTEALDANRLATASQTLGTWAEQFGEWAARLEETPEGQGGGGGGEGGGGDMPPEVLEMILRILRMIDRQEQLRRETVQIDQSSMQDTRRRRITQRLSVDQEVLHFDTGEVREMLTHPQAKALLESTRTVMDDVIERLRRHDAGVETQSGEAAAIELLTRLLAQSSPNSAAANATLARLIQQVTGRAGAAGTGNPALSDGAATGVPPLPGEADDRTPGRLRRRFAGRRPEEYPPEYRRLLESYFERAEGNEDANE